MSSCIREFHDLDPKSVIFRYWDDEGSKSSFMLSNKVDLENVREIMMGIENLLIFAKDELGNLKDGMDEN